MARRPASSLSEPITEQLDLFELPDPQRCNRPPRSRRPRTSAPDDVTYRRATSGDCDRCSDEQATAHAAGHPVPLRRRARWFRAGGGLPTELLCAQHRAADKSNR